MFAFQSKLHFGRVMPAKETKRNSQKGVSLSENVGAKHGTVPIHLNFHVIMNL